MKLVLIINIIAIGVALLTAGILAWTNAGSRNLPIATGALAATVILFLIQLPFELRRSRERYFLTAEFVIDRSKPQIREWNYPDSTMWRIHDEIDASNWLAEQHPEHFDGDRDRVTSDMVLFSLISFLASSEFDWQRRRIQFSGSTTGTITTWDRLSRPEECTTVAEEQLRSLLRSAGNLYVGAPLRLIAGQLCLPPKTYLSLTSGELQIRNLYCEIVFKLRSSGSISYMKPGTGGQVPKLPSGDAQYETRLIGVEIDLVFTALRAQSRDMLKYREWAHQLVNGAIEWFQGGNRRTGTEPDTSAA